MLGGGAFRLTLQFQCAAGGPGQSEPLEGGREAGLFEYFALCSSSFSRARPVGATVRANGKNRCKHAAIGNLSGGFRQPKYQMLCSIVRMTAPAIAPR